MWPFTRFDDDLARLNVLILFVTSLCNARCDACFNWQRLNDDDGVMNLDEIRRLSASMPAFPNLVLSGGEPTLRDDAADIVRVFAEQNSTAAVDIPTNGLLPDKAVALVERVLTENTDLRMTLAVSVDGLADTHDELRGVPGGFEKALETARAIDALRANGPNDWNRRLSLVGITCLNQRNIDEYPQLVDVLTETADFDLINFEAIRETSRETGLEPPPPNVYRETARRMLGVNRKLLSKRLGDELNERLSYIEQMHEIQAGFLESGQIPLRCMAGRRVAVVEHDAKLKLCELKEAVADLRAMDFDFAAGWNCAKAIAQRRDIYKTRCACGHCVIVGHSIDDDPATRRAREAKRDAASR